MQAAISLSLFMCAIEIKSKEKSPLLSSNECEMSWSARGQLVQQMHRESTITCAANHLVHLSFSISRMHKIDPYLSVSVFSFGLISKWERQRRRKYIARKIFALDLLTLTQLTRNIFFFFFLSRDWMKSEEKIGCTRSREKICFCCHRKQISGRCLITAISMRN